MVDEVGFPFKIDDGLMVGIGVPGYFIEDTFIDPGPIDVLAHGIAYFSGNSEAKDR